MPAEVGVVRRDGGVGVLEPAEGRQRCHRARKPRTPPVRMKGRNTAGGGKVSRSLRYVRARWSARTPVAAHWWGAPIPRPPRSEPRHDDDLADRRAAPPAPGRLCRGRAPRRGRRCGGRSPRRRVRLPRGLAGPGRGLHRHRRDAHAGQGVGGHDLRHGGQADPHRVGDARDAAPGGGHRRRRPYPPHPGLALLGGTGARGRRRRHAAPDGTSVDLLPGFVTAVVGVGDGELVPRAARPVGAADRDPASGAGPTTPPTRTAAPIAGTSSSPPQAWVPWPPPGEPSVRRCRGAAPRRR